MTTIKNSARALIFLALILAASLTAVAIHHQSLFPPPAMPLSEHDHQQRPNQQTPEPSPAPTSDTIPAPSPKKDPQLQDHLRQLREEAARKKRDGDTQAAIVIMAKALALTPDDDLLNREMSHLNAVMGWTMLEKKEYDKAMGFFEEAVHYWKENEDAVRGMAFTLYQDHESDLARQWLLYYIQLGGTQPDAYSLLGRIYYDDDRLEDALMYFNLSLSLSPEQPQLVAFIAKVQRELKVEEGFAKTESGHFTVKFEGQENPRVGQLVLAVCEEAYLRVGVNLGFFPDRTITVILYSDEQFQDVTNSPAWAGAIYDGKIRIPVKGLADRSDILLRLVFHEYTHALLHEMTAGQAPVWLQEGLAQMNDGGSYDLRALAVTVRNNNALRPLKELEGSFLGLPPREAKLAYAQSYLAAAYLADAYGPYALREILRLLKEGKNASAAITEFTARGPEEFFADFTAWVEDQAQI
jgi:hypothetical protein